MKNVGPATNPSGTYLQDINGAFFLFFLPFLHAVRATKLHGTSGDIYMPGGAIYYLPSPPRKQLTHDACLHDFFFFFRFRFQILFFSTYMLNPFRKTVRTGFSGHYSVVIFEDPTFSISTVWGEQVASGTHIQGWVGFSGG